MNKREYNNYEFIKNIKANIITNKNNSEEIRESEEIFDKTGINSTNLKTDLSKANSNKDIENKLNKSNKRLSKNIGDKSTLTENVKMEGLSNDYYESINSNIIPIVAADENYGNERNSILKIIPNMEKNNLVIVDKSISLEEITRKSNNSSNQYSITSKDKNVAFSEEEWNEILKNRSSDNLNLDRLKLSLKSGVIDKLRGKVWILLSKCLEAAVFHSDDVYYKLLEIKDEHVDNLIQRDLDRTILYTIDESGQLINMDIKSKLTKLFRILKAYAIYDTEVSYMQGTNFIVAVLLYKIKSERACFWIFYQIMNKKGWRNFFIEHTPKLIQMLELLNIHIREEIPELYKHFEKENFVDLIPAVFTQFFVTLCTYNAPIEYACRIIDLFWIYEERIIFDAILHLLKLQVQKLVKMDDEKMHRYIKSDIIYDVIKTYGFENALPF